MEGYNKIQRIKAISQIHENKIGSVSVKLNGNVS
jgi:hypothetical protein